MNGGPGDMGPGPNGEVAAVMMREQNSVNENEE